MNIYFSCSITGGRQDQSIYQALVEAMLHDGHEVPTAILSRPDVMSFETVIAPYDVYRRDVNWVKQCDVLVAEVSTPSHGVGYEIALAVLLGKPVLCCYQSGRRVSKMITGNDSPNLRVVSYENSDQAIRLVRDFLETLQTHN